jgi:hypothetical protein
MDAGSLVAKPDLPQALVVKLRERGVVTSYGAGGTPNGQRGPPRRRAAATSCG